MIPSDAKSVEVIDPCDDAVNDVTGSTRTLITLQIRMFSREMVSQSSHSMSEHLQAFVQGAEPYLWPTYAPMHNT